MRNLVGSASETHPKIKNLNNDDGIPIEQLLIRDRPKTIIGLDGEGITVPHVGEWGINQQAAEHRYTLLANSSREYVENANGLSTEQCFNFLVSLNRQEIRSSRRASNLFVGFSIGYDINMMLKDLSLKHVEHLIKYGHTYWKHWSIKLKTHRTFYIKNRKTNESILIYDVFGFFQCSFVKALRTWGVGDEQTISDIAAMKEQRGEFDLEHSNNIRVYCFKECELLVALMQRLVSAVNRAEIPTTNWYGVGALASGLMRKYRIKDYLATPPDELRVPVLSAYYGGRFEIAGTGHFGRVYGYDIKSAYPSVARSLPCLKHTTYIHHNSYTVGSKPAVCRVRWDVDRNARWGPFPWRTINKAIYYPLNGEGWYWSVEVAAAKRIFGKQVRILESYELETTCKETPFAFIDGVYEERLRLETLGDYANKALKLALNALYGKCAQSLGNPKRKPPFQSYIWAGMITAGTRAQILDAIAVEGDSIISIATDGILSTAPIESLTIGKKLGQWETTVWNQCFLVQPGIYRLNNATDKVEHTRGFGSKETDFDAIERDYIHNPLGKHEYKATRFVSAAAALAHNNTLDYWRRWIETTRIINFGQARRMITVESLAAARHGIEPVMHDAVNLANVELSTPYEPKQTWLDSWKDDVDVLLDMEQP